MSLPLPAICRLCFIQSLEHVLKEVRGEDIIIPHTRYGWEALHAVYGRSCLSVMLTHIGLQRLKIIRILPFLSVREGPGTSGLYEWRCISVYQHQCRRGFVSC